MTVFDIQVRRGTTAEWAASDRVLLRGEPAYNTDTGEQKIGNGVDTWKTLPTWTGQRNGTTDLLRPTNGLPTFVKHASNPVMTHAAQQSVTGLGSVYWPFVVDTSGLALTGTPPARYLMYYSTDHDSGAGGIGLAVSSSPTGPFLPHSKVYVDTVAGTQTETPTVIFDERAGLLNMYYQQDGVGTNQSTLLATSPNGVAWTRIGVVMDVAGIAGIQGDGHSGYARIFRAGQQWIAFSLYGGGDYPGFAQWYSNDGRNWTMDPRILIGGADITGNINRRVEWNSINLFEFRGNVVALFSTKDYVSGGNAGVSEDYVAQMHPSLRSVKGIPLQVLAPRQGFENVDTGAVDCVMSSNGKLYAYYRTNGAQGSISVAVAEA